ncbi:Oligopeptidase A [Cellulophaga lytica DSM 7489]|uniref:Oligopeptidase A n=1 Tax=Cellulophaga lytica (strain ATCC 23178 / DSM 7489 / JCM 8516 / NBRC 14961 / NCIMB 1423 / VKM B-1433 / Cy l20) TaxID=867900 RepID=F0REF3_CELLC|nr:M3 family metallopeptidase [Cellulophaga lytica]ADY29928.1 Oligopeptidase A [Cellulophaga lytica DSM 7489]WQG75908.1 M3 family metallopeptidase [Cellulophaga lytica]
MNPLLSPFDTAPFSQIENEHFMPAFTQAMTDARAEIDAITENKEVPTFTNTIEALDFAGQQLDRISSVFFNLNSAETNEKIQKIAQEVSPLLSEFGNDITLNEALFKRVKAVYEQKDNLDLTVEQQTLLDKRYKGFSRNGANLAEDKKTRLREIDAELSKLKLKFGENVLAETNKFKMHLTNEEDLDGLPEGEKEAAAQLAKSKDLDGWLITLDYPSYIPFMKYAKNRELRKKLSLAFGSKAFKGDELDNQENVLKIAKLRHERANLLGYATHANFVLEERMAETPEKVHSFLNELLEKAKPAAEREFKQLEDFAKELDGIDQLQKWDGAYYSEKLKQKLFNLDDEILKPYFKLENVIAGVFKVAEKLFGLQFKEVTNVDKYHEDVKTYEVFDAENTFVSLFYADFHPRSGKRGGAWMTSYKPQYIKDGVNVRPHISNVCNFTKPTNTKPSLLTFNEVTTLFHEFGHGLHGMLANTTYSSLSGTSVYWDFVELPSQVLENWCYEKEALELFATHYQTGEVIPMELVQKIKESATFQEGMQTLRQLSFGLLDMSWHGVDPTNFTNVKAQEDKAFTGTDLYPSTAETCMSTAFSHIFQGGYSSGYYSYKWAEVLDADAFAYFKEEGIFNKDVATKFKDNVLSKGGTENPMVLYKRFRGAEPKVEALLERAGLL